jgi:type VI secretion system secreted protein Hcp
MAIYLEHDGIKGNVTAEGFKDHVAVLSTKFGIKRRVAMEPGRMANREASRPTISEITLIKRADKSTPDFFKESVSGSKGKKAVLKFVHTGGDVYMQYVLTNAMIGGYKIGAGDRFFRHPIETITISFSGLEVRYTPHNEGGKLLAPVSVAYDLAAAAVR